jgi:hypothetical protein
VATSQAGSIRLCLFCLFPSLIIDSQINLPWQIRELLKEKKVNTQLSKIKGRVRKGSAVLQISFYNRSLTDPHHNERLLLIIVA